MYDKYSERGITKRQARIEGAIIVIGALLTLGLLAVIVFGL